MDCLPGSVDPGQDQLPCLHGVVPPQAHKAGNASLQPNEAALPPQESCQVTGIDIVAASKALNHKRFKRALITLQDLQQVFHLKREDAAGRLGIGLSTLKRVCQMHGVTRWPYRKLEALQQLQRVVGSMDQHHFKGVSEEVVQQNIADIVNSPSADLKENIKQHLSKTYRQRHALKSRVVQRPNPPPDDDCSMAAGASVLAGHSEADGVLGDHHDSAAPPPPPRSTPSTRSKRTSCSSAPRTCTIPAGIQPWLNAAAALIAAVAGESEEDGCMVGVQAVGGANVFVEGATDEDSMMADSMDALNALLAADDDDDGNGNSSDAGDHPAAQAVAGAASSSTAEGCIHRQLAQAAQHYVGGPGSSYSSTHVYPASTTTTPGTQCVAAPCAGATSAALLLRQAVAGNSSGGSSSGNSIRGGMGTSAVAAASGGPVHKAEWGAGVYGSVGNSDHSLALAAAPSPVCVDKQPWAVDSHLPGRPPPAHNTTVHTTPCSTSGFQHPSPSASPLATTTTAAPPVPQYPVPTHGLHRPRSVRGPAAVAAQLLAECGERHRPAALIMQPHSTGLPSRHSVDSTFSCIDPRATRCGAVNAHNGFATIRRLPPCGLPLLSAEDGSSTGDQQLVATSSRMHARLPAQALMSSTAHSFEHASSYNFTAPASGVMLSNRQMNSGSGDCSSAGANNSQYAAYAPTPVIPVVPQHAAYSHPAMSPAQMPIAADPTCNSSMVPSPMLCSTGAVPQHTCNSSDRMQAMQPHASGGAFSEHGWEAAACKAPQALQQAGLGHVQSTSSTCTIPFYSGVQQHGREIPGIPAGWDGSAAVASSSSAAAAASGVEPRQAAVARMMTAIELEPQPHHMPGRLMASADVYSGNAAHAQRDAMSSHQPLLMPHLQQQQQQQHGSTMNHPPSPAAAPAWDPRARSHAATTGRVLSADSSTMYGIGQAAPYPASVMGRGWTGAEGSGMSVLSDVCMAARAYTMPPALYNGSSIDMEIDAMLADIRFTGTW